MRTPEAEGAPRPLTKAQARGVGAALVGGLLLFVVWLLWFTFWQPYLVGYDDTSGGKSSERSNAWIYRACLEPASENYNRLDWSQGWPPPDVNRRAESYMQGCLDGARGNSFNPLRALDGTPE